jgi:hypothetical protein
MAKSFAQKIEQVKEEAKAPYKAQIMFHHLKKIMAEPPKTEAEKKAFQEKTKEESKILSEGLEAVGRLAEIGFAVSTSKRFGEWAEHKGIKHDYNIFIDRKDWNKGKLIEMDGKWWIPAEEFKQTGYGAWHIGDRINRLQKEGRDVFVLDAPRNRRFLFKEAKAGELEKIVS